MVQHDAAGCFGNSCGYSVVQSHWNAVVSAVSGLQLPGYACCFPWYVFAADTHFSGGIGCGIVTKASPSMRSRVRKPNQPAAVACSSVTTGAVHPHRSKRSTIRAQMDLALPKFADTEDRPVRPHRPWVVMTDSPASPAPVRSTGLLRSPSPCLNLDALSSDEHDESAGPNKISTAPICVSDDCHTPVNTDLVLSDEAFPAAVNAGDLRQVIRIRDVSPDVQIVNLAQVGRDWDTRQTVWGARHPKDIPGVRLQQSACAGALSPEARASNIPPDRRFDTGSPTRRCTSGGKDGDRPTFYAS